MTGGAIPSYKSTSGSNHESTRSCLNNALARQIHHKSISDNRLDAVTFRLLHHPPSLRSRPSCLVLFSNPDSFFSVKKAHQSRAPLSLAAVQYCMAGLRGHMLNRCGLCGISGWLHMLSDDRQRIRSDRSWLRTFCFHSRWICRICFVTGVFHRNYTQRQHV